MTEYDDTNKGALFAAKERKTDKHPTHTGKLNVGGKEYYLSAWVREAKSGQKYFSLAVKAKDEQAQERTPPPNPGHLPPDEIPF